MKWFPEVPDCWKAKPEQVAGPSHHFDVKLSKPDPRAKKDCAMCKGRGCYTVLDIGEYDEMPRSIKCACINRR